MKTNNKLTKAICPMGAGFLAVAMGAAQLLSGCSGGGSNSGTSVPVSPIPWPSAPPPAVSQANTYIGTQSPGLYTVTIDHTSNTFSYQDLSAGSGAGSAAVSGTFTTAVNGFLVLSIAGGQTGYALEQLSRAVLLVPPLEYKNGSSTVSPISAPIFAITASACQVIPSRTEFEYIAPANSNFGIIGSSDTDELGMGSGLVYASTDSSGANWEFWGELQYEFPTAGLLPISFSPIPDPFSATCAASTQGPSLLQTTITKPSSVPATFAIGPTGFLVEDRYQSDGQAFVGAVAPQSPVDLSHLSGATFLGMYVSAGATTSNNAPQLYAPPQLFSFSASPDSSGTGIKLTGGEFPSNNPTQTPGTGTTIDLGAQDPLNNGYFPSATIGSAMSPGVALISNAGGKYTIFLTSAAGAASSGWILFQQ